MADDKINDGFGDDVRIERRREMMRQLFGTVSQPHVHAPTVGGAYVSPTGKQEIKLEQKEAPPVRMSAAPLPSGSAGRGALLKFWAALQERGWQRTNSVDGWLSPNGRMIVETGYVHGAMWARSWWTRERSVIVHRMDILGSASNEEIKAAAAGVTLDSSAPVEVGGAAVDWPTKGDLLAPRLDGNAPLAFQLLTQRSKLPTRTYADDAGFDLYTVDTEIIEQGEFCDIPLGVAVGLPSGYWGRITGRSSTLRTWGLVVNEGIIDTGYTGPLFAGVLCTRVGGVKIEAGTRIAQLIIHRNESFGFEPVEVEALAETERGVKGFGSSGR